MDGIDAIAKDESDRLRHKRLKKKLSGSILPWMSPFDTFLPEDESYLEGLNGKIQLTQRIPQAVDIEDFENTF